jgi:hypothetical protein
MNNRAGLREIARRRVCELLNCRASLVEKTAIYAFGAAELADSKTDAERVVALKFCALRWATCTSRTRPTTTTGAATKSSDGGRLPAVGKAARVLGHVVRRCDRQSAASFEPHAVCSGGQASGADHVSYRVTAEACGVALGTVQRIAAGSRPFGGVVSVGALNGDRQGPAATAKDRRRLRR